MELNTIVEIIETLKKVPVYAWVILAFLILFVFGDRKKWDEKARFFKNGMKWPGRIEIGCYKRKGMYISVELGFGDKYSNQPLDIYVNNYLALTIPAKHTKWSHVKYKGKYNLRKPGRGELVEVKSNGETILSSTIG